jgi:hypothetical protein
MDTQNFSRHRKTKIKYQKPVVKVVHDMLIKKWVFMKRKKQFSLSTSEDEHSDGHESIKAQPTSRCHRYLHCPRDMNVTPSFKVKLNDHNMCAQESNLHTYRTTNEYRITNVINI